MMIKKEPKKRKPKAEAFLQILILVVGIISVSYLIGSSIGVVSASGNGDEEEVCGEGLTKCLEGQFYKCDSGKWEVIPDTSNICESPSLSGADYDLTGFANYNTDPTKKSSASQLTNGPKVTPGQIYRWYDTGTQLLNDFEEGTSPLIDQREDKGKEKEMGGASTGFRQASRFLAKGSLSRVILGNAAIAAGLYAGISYLGKVISDDPNIQRAFNVAGIGASAGYFAATTARRIAMKAAEQALKKAGEEVTKQAILTKVSTMFGTKGLGGAFGAFMAWPGFGWVLAGVGIVISVLAFNNKRQQQITFECKAWQPQTGGEECELCNNQGLIPCTEYQCKSLGQGCELINKGTKNEKCIWINRNDINYPVIKAWQNALLSEEYRYSPSSAISPPDKGVNIIYSKSSDGCIPAFTPLSFGVALDEPAKCKISPIRTESFESMGNLYLSQGFADYNHSFALSLPSAESLEAENITIENNGKYELFVRCEDANGNTNPANFVFKYCVSQEPDYTNPFVVATDPLNGLPIAHNTKSTIARFYINEPAECKWSRLDKDYENMENSMTCSTSALEMNARMSYRCIANLTGIEDNVENKFYVRCRDQPSATEQRNTNTESYEYVLIGTEPLILNEVTPNNTLVKGSTSAIKVTIKAKTSAGYNDGVANCYYSETGENGSYIQFYNTNSFEHSQDLWLSQGSYDFYIRCVDLGGNAKSSKINFDVETDTTAPVISRAYYEEGYLKIITDEKAKCVYDKINCDYNFDEGIAMLSVKDTEHFVTWNSNSNFYIKCGETREAGIRPPKDECSLIIRPLDLT